MSATRLALFDCDGTLVDSQADICAAMEAAYAGIGMAAPDRSDIRRIVGLSVPEAVRALASDLPPDMKAQLAEGYRNAYMEMRQRGELQEPLYEGMADLLAALHDGGWQLGVATGKSDRGLVKCLEHHGLKDMFVTLQTADRHPSKPHPSMARQAMADAQVTAARTVMIGDTSFDMAMAQAAGCGAIGVAWGYHEADELMASGAQIVVDTMAELRTALENAV